MTLVDHIQATPEDRAVFRAALRGALLRYAAECREHAEFSCDEDRAELLAEAHAAMQRAVQLEDA